MEAALASFYGKLNYGKHSAGRLMAGVIKPSKNLVPKGQRFEYVLEVGVGTGEHLRYVKHPFGTYTMLDRNAATLNIGVRARRNWRATGEGACYPRCYL